MKDLTPIDLKGVIDDVKRRQKPPRVMARTRSPSSS